MWSFEKPSVIIEEKPKITQQPYEKLPLLNENELSNMSNLDFLETPHNDRLQYISNVNSKDILEKWAKYIEFNFHQNKKLYSMTTAGQIMPDEVRTIKTKDWKTWTRSENSLSWEFFNENNVRLIIWEWMSSKFKWYKNIEISELATSEELWEIKDRKESELKKYLENNNLEESYEDKDILIAIINKWLDPKIIFDIILPLVDNLSNEERSAKIEYILTWIERTRWKFNVPESELNDFMSTYLVENKVENIVSKEKISTLVQKYFPTWVNIGEALRIIEAESSFNSNSKRDFYKNPGGWNDLWLFQINDYYQRDNIAKLGFTANDMFDVEKNIQVASIAYREAWNTWKPWIAAREMWLA